MISNQENRSFFLKFNTPTSHNQVPLTQRFPSNQQFSKNYTPNYRYPAQGKQQINSNGVSTKWFSNNANTADKNNETRPNKSYTFSMLRKNKNNHRNHEPCLSQFSQIFSPRYQFKLPNKFSKNQIAKDKNNEKQSQQLPSNIKFETPKIRFDINNKHANAQFASISQQNQKQKLKIKDNIEKIDHEKDATIAKLQQQLTLAKETIGRQSKQMNKFKENQSIRDCQVKELKNKINKYENTKKTLTSQNYLSISVCVPECSTSQSKETIENELQLLKKVRKVLKIKDYQSDQEVISQLGKLKKEAEGFQKIRKERDHLSRLLRKQDSELIRAGNANSLLALQIQKYAQILDQCNQQINILQLRSLQHRLQSKQYNKNEQES